jgi:hypothetical protein
VADSERTINFKAYRANTFLPGLGKDFLQKQPTDAMATVSLVNRNIKNLHLVSN